MNIFKYIWPLIPYLEGRNEEHTKRKTGTPTSRDEMEINVDLQPRNIGISLLINDKSDIYLILWDS